MLISSSTKYYGDLSSVANYLFSDVWPYLVLVLGIILGFFIIEMLISLTHPNKTGYFIGNERMKDQDLGKNLYEIQNEGKTRFD